jgi:hypothetical protein
MLPVLLLATLYVDDSYSNPTPPYYNNIQNAIDNFVDGDVIYVYPGAYNENITNNVNGVYKAVDIRSNYYISGKWEDVENTVINGLNSSTVSLAGSVTYIVVKINGFTIQNGSRGLTMNHTHAEIKNCIINNNISAGNGGGAYVNSGQEALFENCIFHGNEADNGGGIYSSHNPINLTNCVFYDNEATDDSGGAICFAGVDNCYDLTISRCLFYENIADENGGAIYYPGNSAAGGADLLISYSTFADNISTGNGAKGIHLGYSGIMNVEMNDIIIVEASPNMNQTSTTPDIDIDKSCIKNGCYNTNATLTDCIITDPDFVNSSGDDYHIKWNSDCIDYDDTSLDADYSPSDLGCYPYERDEFIMDATARYHWHCFPRMDVGDEVNNGENDDYLCPDDCMDAFWSTVPSVINVYNSLGVATVGTNYGGDLSWSDPTYQFYSYNGLKFGSDSNSYFYIGGYLMDPDYEFDDLTSGVENWLGYFLEESQHVDDAIDSADLALLLEVKTQRWSMVRASLHSAWNISANYIINYGDLVILKPGATVTDFQWQQSRDAVEPYIRPRAEHFVWEDEIDYLPILVDFDPSNVPTEIAVYVNNVCKGAQVVDDTFCQICAYILEEEPGAEIEFAFYDGDRSIRRSEFLVLDNLSGQVTGSNLVTGTQGSFYTVSFRGDQEVPPALKYDLHAEPNPFNPSTAICFELEEENNVSLNIYNSKGQFVRSLANEVFRPGSYRLIWDGRNDKGSEVSSGVYFYKMECGSDVISGKMVMMK